MTKKFGRPVVASEIFKDYCGGDWGAQGDEELRGLSEKHSVFVPGPKNLAGDGASRAKSDGDKGRSEAEEIMLLLRGTDGPKSEPPTRSIR